MRGEALLERHKIQRRKDLELRQMTGCPEDDEGEIVLGREDIVRIGFRKRHSIYCTIQHTMTELETLLAKCDIPYQRFDHQAVFTCGESEKLNIEMLGAHTKQLLLRDKKKRNYVLAIVMHDKQVDTKALGTMLETGSLGFASPDDLRQFLGVEPGSVTPFGLMFDHEHRIRLVIDEDAWAIGTFRFHPLINTATLVIYREGLQKFLQQTGHTHDLVQIPQKKSILSSTSSP